MAAPCYIAWNGDTSALTAAPTAVTTGTSLKTMLQIKPNTSKIRIIEWGYSFDVLPSALVRVELINTGTVAATVTTMGSGVRPYNDATGSTSSVAIGTSATGFTATAEGTVVSSRLLAYQHEWGQQFKQQFPLGREPEVNAGDILRIRATTATAVNMTCYVIWEE